METIDFDDFDSAFASISAMTSESTDDPSMPQLNETKDDGIPIPLMHGKIPEVNLAIRKFRTIEKYFEDTPDPLFSEKDYYKKCLAGEGEASQRLHSLLAKYLNCTDKADRTVFRQQIISAYWEFVRSIAPKMTSSSIPAAKKMALRYGVLLPSLFSPAQKDLFSRAIREDKSYEPVLYLDEWIKEITAGNLNPSTTDETPIKSSSPDAEQERLRVLQSKNVGKLQVADNFVRQYEMERGSTELRVKGMIDDICKHPGLLGLSPHTEPYNETQKKMFSEIINEFRTLQRLDKEIVKYVDELREAKEIEQSLAEKQSMAAEGAVAVGRSEILGEMNTIRQMHKITCGRQGNQFPIFTKEFCHTTEKGTGFRENVLRELAWIESIDPGCFCRIHKGVPNRIVPYTLLIPSYGDSGFCWEPFDRYNRVSSRGRIVIPMYPRDLKMAVISAVADLRWQVAKEKASFDWMSDGLTGMYYQFIESKKLKGDIKQFFIDDYVLWLTKEANGTQKLDKEVRGIFWRYMPFPDELKEDLKKRSLVYQELFQRDVNRSMSDYVSKSL